MFKSSDPMDDDWTGEGEKIPVNADGSIRMEEWNYGRGASKAVPAASQRTVESTAKEGRATPMAAPLHDTPVPHPLIPCKGKDMGCHASVYAKYQQQEDMTGWRNGWCQACVAKGLSEEASKDQATATSSA